MQSLNRCLSLLAFSALAAAAAWAGERPAHAILNYYIYESGGALVVQTQGSLSLPAQPKGTSSIACLNALSLDSFYAQICAGPVGVSLNAYELNEDTSLIGNFNIIENVPPATPIGESTILQGTSAITGYPLFGIRSSYTNGDPINSGAIYPNQTLAGANLPASGLVGTYTLTGTNDRINVCVGNPGSFCSPAPGPLPLLGAAAAFGYSRRLRRRVSLSRSTSPSSTSISA